MSFLFPAYLAGLALVAIPVIIHLFNFQRARRVYFTNVAFLKTVRETTNARDRLKNLLVLLMRVLFVAALVMAFAQPYIPLDSSGVPPATQSGLVSIYLDNSYSMQAEQGGRRMLDVGRNYAEQISRAFPANTAYQFLENGFDASSGYFTDASRLVEKVSKAEFANSSRLFAEIADKQSAAFRLQGAEGQRQAFWLSDFQKSTAGQLAEAFADTLTTFFLIPLLADPTENLAIDSVWLTTPFVRELETNTVNIIVRNFGDEPATDKIVTLFIEDKQVASGSVNIPAGGTATLKLDFTVTEPGQKACRLSVEDYPVIFDNDYFFVLRVAPTIRVAHVYESQSNYVPNLFNGERFFQLESFSSGQVNVNVLANADLIVLDGVKEIDQSLQEAMTIALEGGATVALFPSAQSVESSYSNLTGLPISKESGIPSAEAQVALQAPDANAPFFEGVFEKVVPNMSMPKAQRVIGWPRSGEDILRFRNAQAFMTALDRRNGRIFLFATPLNSQFTDFPLHALFVPVMYKMALNSKMRAEKLAFEFGEAVAAIPLDSLTRGEIFKLRPLDYESGQAEIIPEQRIAGNRLLLSIPKSRMEAGIYHLIRSSDGSYADMVAFNYDHQESVLSTYSAAELKELLAGKPHVKVVDQINEERFVRDFQQKSMARPLWRYFIIAALLFLLAEALLLRFWKRGAATAVSA